MPSLLCLGLGYTAGVLADRLMGEGWRVVGTVRGEARAAELKARGFEAIVHDGRAPTPALAAAIGHADAIVSSVPPDDHGDPMLRDHRADLAAAGQAAWIGYLSTTGVYGDRGGDWVDETAELRPSGVRQQRRVDAEAGWLGLWRDAGRPVHVFRLAGIYGPGRSPVATAQRGEARRVYKEGQIFSRIHVADAATVLAASIARPRPGAVYNVADDEPAAPWDVTAYACNVAGVPAPPLVPFESADLSPMARSFYADSKRVSNRLIRTELGVNLAFPDYRAGLSALART